MNVGSHVAIVQTMAAIEGILTTHADTIATATPSKQQLFSLARDVNGIVDLPAFRAAPRLLDDTFTRKQVNAAVAQWELHGEAGAKLGVQQLTDGLTSPLNTLRVFNLDAVARRDEMLAAIQQVVT